VSKSPSALVSNPILMTDETCSLVAPADFATSAHEAATSAAADVIAACIFMPLKLFDQKDQFPIVPTTTVDNLATERAAFSGLFEVFYPPSSLHIPSALYSLACLPTILPLGP